MVYQGKEYNGIREIFDKALDIARHNPEEASKFMEAYAVAILNANSSCNTMEDAMQIAKSNLGYFSGYCDNEICDLIYKTFKINHPIFG